MNGTACGLSPASRLEVRSGEAGGLIARPAEPGTWHIGGRGHQQDLTMRIQTSFLFDLDGTLVDSVYQHVLAWKEALDSEGISL